MSEREWLLSGKIAAKSRISAFCDLLGRVSPVRSQCPGHSRRPRTRLPRRGMCPLRFPPGPQRSTASGRPIRLVPLLAETRAKDLGLVCWRGVLGGCCLAAGPAGVFHRQGDEGGGDGQDDRCGQDRYDGPRRKVRRLCNGGRERRYRCKGRCWRSGGCPRGRGQADGGGQADRPPAGPGGRPGGAGWVCTHGVVGQGGGSLAASADVALDGPLRCPH